MLRTHTCNDATDAMIGQEITLAGWVSNRRDHGGIIFIDLRDRYGITQIVFDPADDKTAWEEANTYRSEYVIQVTGKVRPRPEGQDNPRLNTGKIEVIITQTRKISESKTPPFELDEHSALPHEDIRFKYRFVDLRRKQVQNNVIFRSKFIQMTRNWFHENAFTEVQTPIFTVSSPEGARDYLIPSRINPGKFYALPQAPQQYKQLLMVGGLDKYFQIAPCFRDEDPRADRHACEFYQIDCEMSFVEQADVFEVVEKYVRHAVGTMSEKTIFDDTFYTMSYDESMENYGTDKPDLRFGMKFVDLTDIFANSGFSVFKSVHDNGGVIKAIKLEGQTMSRGDIDNLTAIAQKAGAKGLAYIIYDPTEGAKSPILKFFTDEEKVELEKRMEPKTGDIIFFSADEFKKAVSILNTVRLALRDKYNLADINKLAFCWIKDFPMFEQDEKTGKLDFSHNPFSMPIGGVEAYENQDLLAIKANQYDLSCNGYEILSGSIRNYDTKALIKAFEIVGRSEEEVKNKFGAMYEAFQYGVPPHGGFAIGLDRWMMILMDEDNIREVYAFPKSGKAQDAMMGAPGDVDDAQLEELHIQISDEVREELQKEQNVGNRELAEKIKSSFLDQKVMTHAAVKTSEEASKVRGTSLSNQAKALILKSDNEYVLCVIPADQKLSHEKIEAITGKKLKMADKEEIQSKYKLIQGGVPPFGSLIGQGIPTYIDEKITKVEKLSFNIGVVTESFIDIPTKQYLDFEKGTIVDIT